MGIVDLHCDTMTELYKRRLAGSEENLYENRLHLDLVRMRKSKYGLQCFAIFLDKEQEQNLSGKAKELIGFWEACLIEYREHVAKACNAYEIERNARANKISAILSLEEGAIFEGNLESIEEFYRLGVRMSTITWNYENELVDHKGMTAFGYEAIEKMEDLGMIVDVSHLREDAFWQLEQVARKPYLASHSNAYDICKHKRNLKEEQIRAIANRGGVIGLNYYPPFLTRGMLKEEDFVRHITYIYQKGGSEVLALGSDFDGIDTNPLLPHVGEIDFLWDILSKAGISHSIVEKMQEKNASRFLQDLLS